MNRRNFLKGIGQTVLAGLLGGFVVAEELEKFTKQKEREWQISNSEGDDFDNTEWVTDNETWDFWHNEIDGGWNRLSDGVLLNFEPIYVEPLSAEYKFEIYKEHFIDWYMKLIALGMGVSQEDLI